MTRERRQPPPRWPHHLALRVDGDTLDRLRAVAARHDTSVAAVARDAIDAGLGPVSDRLAAARRRRRGAS